MTPNFKELVDAYRDELGTDGYADYAGDHAARLALDSAIAALQADNVRYRRAIEVLGWWATLTEGDGFDVPREVIEANAKRVLDGGVLELPEGVRCEP
jgi:hypothetical protein